MNSLYNRGGYYDEGMFLDVSGSEYRLFNDANDNNDLQKHEKQLQQQQEQFNQETSTLFNDVNININLEEENIFKLQNPQLQNSELQNSQQQKTSSLLPLNDDEGYKKGIPDIEYQGIDIFLMKFYRYYLHGGYWNIIISHLIQLCILIFFVIFCLFIFGAVDYSALMSYNNHNTTYSFGNVVNTYWLSKMNGYFVICLILFSLYVVWKLIRIGIDAKNMLHIKHFYNQRLGISDFELQTMRWTHVITLLNNHILLHGYMSLEPWDISSRIMKKDNYLIALIHHGVLKHGLPLGPKRFVSFMQTQYSKGYKYFYSDNIRLPKFILKVFGKILIWSITYCIGNFLVDEQNQLHRDIVNSESSYIKNDLVSRMQKRLRILGLLNFLLLPFLVIFVPIFALFQYGEEFYKNPSSASARNWSFFSRWKFREYNELPHTFKTRMHVTTKYAEQYLKQFPYGVYEYIAKLIAFMASSFIMYFIILSVCNDVVLFNMNLTPGKSVFWWLGLLTTVWVICRNMMRPQPIYFPEKKMVKLNKFLHAIPEKVSSVPNTKKSVMWLKKYFQYKIVSLLVEMVSILLNPFILIFVIGSFDNLSKLIDFVRTNTTEHATIGKICSFSAFDQHINILDFGFGIDKKMEQSIAHYKQTVYNDEMIKRSSFQNNPYNTSPSHSLITDEHFASFETQNIDSPPTYFADTSIVKPTKNPLDTTPINMSEYLANELDQNSVLLHDSGTDIQNLYNIISQNKK